jgi:hypothetical protein
MHGVYCEEVVLQRGCQQELEPHATYRLGVDIRLVEKSQEGDLAGKSSMVL